MSLIKDYAGPAALAVLVGGAVFTGGAVYGSRSTMTAVKARIGQAMQSAQARKAEPAKVAPAPPNPDPRTIASPASQYPASAPQSGTIRRVVGDALVSQEPVASALRTADVER